MMRISRRDPHVVHVQRIQGSHTDSIRPSRNDISMNLFLP